NSITLTYSCRIRKDTSTKMVANTGKAMTEELTKIAEKVII
ncbi:unnamed protein product, partial [Timema podura]|nr:unnamed protein product [Timema podura]